MPVVVIQPSSKDSGLETARPNTNTGSDPVIWMGMYYPPSRYRLLIQFDLSVLPADVWINSAVLRLYVAEVTNPTVTGIFKPFRVTAQWNELTVTWNNQPPFDAGVFGSSAAILGNGWYEWDVTPIVRGWYMGIYPNYGLLLKSDETVPFETKRVYSKEQSAAPQLRPMLEVSYQPLVSVVMAQRPFVSISADVVASNVWQYVLPFDISQQHLVTVFVINKGGYGAEAKLQISPDNVNYMDDGAVFSLHAGQLAALVPMRFGHYIRLAYRSLSPGMSTNLTIWYQAQM